jgi:hypothetical protein
MKNKTELDPYFDGRRPHYCPEYTRQIQGMAAFACLLPVGIVMLAVVFAPELEVFWSAIDRLFNHPIVSLVLIGGVSSALGGRWLVRFLKSR